MKNNIAFEDYLVISPEIKFSRQPSKPILFYINTALNVQMQNVA
jgi:hypothetical protein